jgi:hypothetical protein
MSFSSPKERETALVALAIEQPATARAVFLQAVCGDDQVLRQRLEALLAAHEQLETPSSLQPDSAEPTIKLDFCDTPDEGVGTTLGRYKLLELIGEGGCGVGVRVRRQSLTPFFTQEITGETSSNRVKPPTLLWIHAIEGHFSTACTNSTPFVRVLSGEKRLCGDFIVRKCLITNGAPNRS